MDLIVFYGIIALLPLFFLYQIYRDNAQKKARRRELTKYFKASGTGNLKDAIKLVDDLDSIVPWVRQAAINRVIKNDAKWESERVIDMVMGYLEQWESDGLRTSELLDWFNRFRADKHAAARQYWQAVHNGIRSAFKDGADAIPDSFTPGQQKKPQEG